MIDVSNYTIFLKQEFGLMNNYVLHKMFSTMIYPVAKKVSVPAETRKRCMFLISKLIKNLNYYHVVDSVYI